MRQHKRTIHLNHMRVLVVTVVREPQAQPVFGQRRLLDEWTWHEGGLTGVKDAPSPSSQSAQRDHCNYC